MRAAPIITSLDWDGDPCSVAARWPADRALLWLHSGRVHRRWARWSIMASPRAVFRFVDGRSRLEGELPDALAAISLTHDPLRDLDAVLASTSLNIQDLPEGDPPLPYRGGWIGFVSYDLGRAIEPRACRNPEADAERGWPLIELAWCPEALVFDHVERQWIAVQHSDAPAWIRSCETKALRNSGFRLGELEAEIEPHRYEDMVARTIEYIAAGDIFQANIAQRFHAGFHGSTRSLAMTAFERGQPWYGAYLESLDAGRRLLSLSPELFLQTSPLTRRIVTRPIKGTRPASSNARELRDSPKDAAELNMIVDLMRNDLGRVCEFGSVRVPHPRLIETHPTVHHGVAEITGRLCEGISPGDILRATFPPGSVTGAPKIRAMQIIDELESNRRGPYCGAIGFISDCGAMTLNVAIRTLLIDGRRDDADRCDIIHEGGVSYSAGAGIVADSIPANELQETLDKAAVLRGLASLQSEASVATATSAPA